MNKEEINYLIIYLKQIIIKDFPKLNSSHEGFAIIKLQSDKLWNDIKNSWNDKNQSCKLDNFYSVRDLQTQAGFVTAAVLYFLESICGITNGLELVFTELGIAESKFPPFNSKLEGFFVLQEEIDELWDVVKLNPKKIIVNCSNLELDDKKTVFEWQVSQRNKMLIEEAVQVAAMGIRFIKCLKV